MVGVNRFTESDGDELPILLIDPAVEERQRKRLDIVRHDRDDDAVRRVLARLAADAAVPDVNLMPAMIEAVSAYATEGEIVDTLAAVFGRWTETPVI